MTYAMWYVCYQLAVSVLNLGLKYMKLKSSKGSKIADKKSGKKKILTAINFSTFVTFVSYLTSRK